MRAAVRRLKVVCRYCGYSTPHLLTDQQTTGHGLVWQCERCDHTTELTSSEASTKERV